MKEIEYKDNVAVLQDETLRNVVRAIAQTSPFLEAGIFYHGEDVDICEVEINVDLVQEILEFKEDVDSGDYPEIDNSDIKDIDMLLTKLTEVEGKGYVSLSLVV